MLLVNARMKHKQKKTGKLREEIINDPGMGKKFPNEAESGAYVLLPSSQAKEKEHSSICFSEKSEEVDE